MTNASKGKGTAWETACVRWLKPLFPHVERRTLQGNKDRGDIAGIAGVVIECKAAKSHDLAGWVDELETEMANDNADIGFLIIKRRGKTSPANAYVLTTPESMLAILKDRNGGVQ
jgi:hypothetical protein